MNFNFTIENLGNIEKAVIEVKPLTIIAGENGTGKSFATKGLYSLLDVLNKNYSYEIYKQYLKRLKYNIVKFDENYTNKSKKDLDFIKDFVDDKLLFLHILDKEFKLTNHVEKLKNSYPRLKQDYEHIQAYYTKQKSLKKFEKVSTYINNILEAYNDILQLETSLQTMVPLEIEANLKQTFQQNFQISNLETLFRKTKKPKNTKLEISSIGTMEILNKKEIDFSFLSEGIVEIQKLANIVYIDSPAYLKVKKALNSKRGFSFLSSFTFNIDEDKYLRDYPLYLDKLYEFIDKEYLETPDFEDLSQELQSLMNGKLNITKSGDIEYLDNNDNPIPLSLTAMGITNIGIIDLLLRNNIINKGSFLIMDEPEAHLHPKWQVYLINILYKVAQSGANIIIATHSIDIIKKVELLLKTEEKAKDFISLNKMPYEESFTKLDTEEKVSQILTDLASPFYDMYLEGL